MSSGSEAAVRGAHIQSGQSPHQPSIFDVLSQESLMGSLKPAVQHILKYLAVAYPGRFSTASKWYDELYALFELILQNHYLKRYGASFSENFYSIKRIAVSTGSIPSQGLARIRSLLILVVWPYIRDKLDALHESIAFGLQILPRRQNEPARIRLARIFHAAYPWLKWTLSSVGFALQLAYLLSRSSIHSPLLYFSGVRLETLTPQDAALFQQIPAQLRQSGAVSRLYQWALALPGMLSRMFGYLLLFVQFVDFFYNSDLGTQSRSLLNKNAQRIPTPPHRRLRESSVMLLDTDKCPICLRRRRNDTVLNVSGYVFCYECIVQFLREEARCPVTSIPATTDNLIRIFHAVPA